MTQASDGDTYVNDTDKPGQSMLMLKRRGVYSFWNDMLHECLLTHTSNALTM